MKMTIMSREEALVIVNCLRAYARKLINENVFEMQSNYEFFCKEFQELPPIKQWWKFDKDDRQSLQEPLQLIDNCDGDLTELVKLFCKLYRINLNVGDKFKCEEWTQTRALFRIRCNVSDSHDLANNLARLYNLYRITVELDAEETALVRRALKECPAYRTETL